MTSLLPALNPQERAAFGQARVKSIAFEAIKKLWDLRKSQGKSQGQIAEHLGKDAGWFSKQLRGPGNWTLKTFGEMAEALHGEVEITVRPLDEPLEHKSNFDAYEEVARPIPANNAELTITSRKSNTANTASSFTAIQVLSAK